jgi:hypothetical protein
VESDKGGERRTCLAGEGTGNNSYVYEKGPHNISQLQLFIANMDNIHLFPIYILLD